MAEPQETNVEVQKQTDSKTVVVGEPTNPSIAPPDVAGPVAAVVSPGVEDRSTHPTRHAAPARSTDKRFERRSANAKKARASHRRSIGRSNTNG